jgi:hypothetical protein
VLVLVHLDDCVQALFQRLAISSESNDREYYPCALVVWPFTADLEELWGIPCVDVVAVCGASVASEDGKVSTGDTEGRSAIVCVAGNSQGIPDYKDKQGLRIEPMLSLA